MFAVSSLTHLSWSEANKAEVCPWAKGFLSHEDVNATREAGWTMIKCGGTFAEALVEEGERRLKTGTLDDQFAQPLNQVCDELTFSPAGEPDAACKKDYALLEKIANTTTLSRHVRGQALLGLCWEGRNKRCIPVLKQFAKNKDPELAALAKKSLDELVQRGRTDQ